MAKKKTSKKGFKRAPTNKKIVAPPKVVKADQQLRKRARHIEAATEHEGGQPGKYVRIDLRNVYRLCVLGMTNEELAEHHYVKYEMWMAWIRPDSKHFKPELSATIRQGREDIVARVADRLVQRALGYKHKAKKFFFDSQSGTVKSVKYIEHYPPSEDAAKFILKNKRPQDWKEKQVLEGPNGSSPLAVNVNVLTDSNKIDKLMADKAAAEKERNKPKQK